MKQINHAQMTQIGGAGAVGDLLAAIGAAVDGALKPVLTGVLVIIAGLIGK